ncbi:MAG: aminopeptidase [Myxococcaceae bacterium]
MARSRSKHQRKRMKIRQAWKKRRNNQKKAATKTAVSKQAKAPAA